MPLKTQKLVPSKKFQRGFQIEAIYNLVKQDKYDRYSYTQRPSYMDSNLPLFVASPETSEKVFTFLGKTVGFQFGAIILKEVSEYLTKKYSLPEVNLLRIKKGEIQKYKDFRGHLENCDKKMISWIVKSITEEFERTTNKLSLRKFDEFTQFCNICNDFIEWFKDIRAQSSKDEVLADTYSLLHKVTKHYSSRLNKNNLIHFGFAEKVDFVLESYEISESWSPQRKEIKFTSTKISFQGI
ncbi:hypothetical protein KAW65_03210 [candidate division WOR-3 bacterium]|nr:hypothetical protein [candidate division WOR-3 bacterium]